MPDNLPAPLPQCSKHGQMQLRPGRTLEQTWCGTWYDCTAPRCGNSSLLSSPELTASLEEQRKNISPERRRADRLQERADKLTAARPATTAATRPAAPPD